MISSEIQAAQANLRRAQERFKCFPECLVEVLTYNSDGRFCSTNFWLGETLEIPLPISNTLRCIMSDPLLDAILHRRDHWNNAEIGCLIRFIRRGPYMPDVHTLMSFFHLPRPQ